MKHVLARFFFVSIQIIIVYHDAMDIISTILK